MRKTESVGVLLAAGFGERFESSIPKQYHKLGNREVISYSIKAMKGAKTLDSFIVVLDETEFLSGRVARNYRVKTVLGGKTRAQSFGNALELIKKDYSDCRKVIFHEAARPMVSSQTLDQYISLLDEFDYVLTCQKIVDSLGCYAGDAPDRDNYYLIQAPEAYRFDMLVAYFDVNSNKYFAGHQMPQTAKSFMNFNMKNNFKLTYPEDLRLFECLLGEDVC